MASHGSLGTPLPDSASRLTYLEGMHFSPGSRYGSVMLTYVQRPVFPALAAATGVYLVICALWFQMRFKMHADLWFDLLVEGIVYVVPLFLVGGIVVALMTHLREQIDDWRATLTPEFRQPHLTIAAALFGSVALATTVSVYALVQRNYSFLGVAALTLTFMTITAWASAFQTSWLSLLVVPLIMLLMRNRRAGDVIEYLITTNPDYPHFGWIIDQLKAYPQQLISLLRLSILVVDGLLLSHLGRRLARSGERREAITRKIRSSPAAEIAIDPNRVHQMATGFLLRAWQRRLAVLGGGAALLMCTALALVLVLLPLFNADHLMFSNVRVDMLDSLILGSIVPAVAVALIWRERSAGFGYESLFPATRPQFAREMAAALAMDLAIYWLAAMVATLAPIVAWRPEAFSLPLTGASLVACVLMQVVSFGAIYASVRVRSILVTMLILGLLLLVSAVPLQLAWSDHPMLSSGQLVVFAGIEMGVGCVLAVLANRQWSCADL